jgi:hypothetical protein
LQVVVMARVGTWANYDEVLGPVVVLDAIAVMHMLARQEFATQDLLHDPAVFECPAALMEGLAVEADVTLRIFPAASGCHLPHHTKGGGCHF